MKLRFKDCHALCELPYFTHDSNGRLVLAEPEKIGPVIDFHQHLGFSFLFSPPLDLKKRSSEVMHNFPMKDIEVDLAIESGENLGRARRDGVRGDYAISMFTNKGPHETHTVPNLIAEMDDLNVRRGVVMAVDFAVLSRNSEAYVEAMAGEERTLPFVAINPISDGWEARMDKLVARGARGLKVHPYSTMLPSDHPRVIRLLRRWSRTGLPVLFHTAFNGLEPFFLRGLARMETYDKPLRMFPEMTFILGHAGMNAFEKAIKYANTYDNVYLEIDNQPPCNMERICAEVDHSRLLFGSDWPFYPISLPLAKVLVSTESDRALRRKILFENADRLLASSAGASEAAACGA